MKNVTRVFTVFLLAALMLFSCAEKNKTRTRPVLKSDTTFVLVALVPPNERDIKHTIALRITRPDSIMEHVVKGGDTLYKKIPALDTIYGYPIYDTLRDNSGTPIRDSAGNYKPTIIYVAVTKNRVWDSGMVRDSIIKRLSPVFKNDTIN